jgi:non-heme chloroperoxidase
VEEAWNVAVAASPIAAIKSFDAWIEDFRADVIRNDLPTLILHADDNDRILPPALSSRRQSKLIKNSKLVEIKDAHNILWTHREVVNQELVSFLAQ